LICASIYEQDDSKGGFSWNLGITKNMEQGED